MGASSETGDYTHLFVSLKYVVYVGVRVWGFGLCACMMFVAVGKGDLGYPSEANGKEDEKWMETGMR